jgi:hypothetical protein
MSKTPEELQKIAEEYERSITPAIEDADNIFKHERIRSFQYGYCAGYEAAKDQQANIGKVIHLVWEQIWRVVPRSTDSGITPCFNETVVGFTRDGRIVFAQHSWDGWIIESDGMERPMSYITHWMPLPKPPEE